MRATIVTSNPRAQRYTIQSINGDITQISRATLDRAAALGGTHQCPVTGVYATRDPRDPNGVWITDRQGAVAAIGMRIEF